MKKIISTICLAGLMFLLAGCNTQKESRNFEIKEHDEIPYYIMKDEYKGDYDIQIKQFKEVTEDTEDEDKYQDFNLSEVMTYSEYKDFCKKWGFEQKYTNENKNYIMFSSMFFYCDELEAKLCDVIPNEEENSVSLYVWDDIGYGYQRYFMGSMEGGINGYMIAIPTDKDYKSVIIEATITEEDFDDVKEDVYYVDKPVIYIYPEKEMDVEVSLKDSDRLTCSYPKYENNWKVTAKPDGTLLYGDKSLYCLYYENKPAKPFEIKDEGFIVKGSEAASFLEEKLAILGLNEKESEEFIIYWLPKLEANKYNYIRFANKNEITENMGLDISPKPDTTIRVLMAFKGLDKPIDVKEQLLEKVEKTGYTVVEWGGTEIK